MQGVIAIYYQWVLHSMTQDSRWPPPAHAPRPGPRSGLLPRANRCRGRHSGSDCVARAPSHCFGRVAALLPRELRYCLAAAEVAHRQGRQGQRSPGRCATRVARATALLGCLVRCTIACARRARLPREAGLLSSPSIDAAGCARTDCDRRAACAGQCLGRAPPGQPTLVWCRAKL